jgi:hypothetical protein
LAEAAAWALAVAAIASTRSTPIIFNFLISPLPWYHHSRGGPPMVVVKEPTLVGPQRK